MYARYAIYYTPAGRLADAGAAWLGWDIRSGQAVRQLDVGLPLPALTADPRRYGFHATLKAPFRLAPGFAARDLERAVDGLAAGLAPVNLPGGVQPRPLGSFLALTPDPQPQALTDLAAKVVERLDPFRAPLTEAEIARRDPASLSPEARDNLHRWGYPHVMGLFRFHVTLTGRTDAETLDCALRAARDAFGPLAARPLAIDALSLVGEDAAGRFHLIRRCPLAG